MATDPPPGGARAATDTVGTGEDSVWTAAPPATTAAGGTGSTAGGDGSPRAGRSGRLRVPPGELALGSGCLVVVAAVLSSAVRGATGPVFSNDEVGHLLLAQYLGGGGPSNLEGEGYYVGWPLLVSPLWWFTDDPALLYRLVLASQVVVAVAGAAALVVFCRALGASRTWSMLVATVVSVAPSRVFPAGYALPEMLAGTLVFAVAAVVALDDRRRRPWFLWVLVPLAVYLPLVHPRFSPVTVALLVHVVLRAAGLPRGRRWPSVVAVLAGGAGIVLALQAATLARAAVWPGTGRTAMALGSPLDVVGTGGAVVALGQAWYGAVASGGTAVLGACVCAVVALGALRRRRSTVHLVLLLATSGVLVLGVLQVTELALSGLRLDYWVYGRYLEPLWCLLAATGLAALATGLGPRLRVAAVALFAAVVAAEGAVLLPSPVSTEDWVPLNVAALSPYPWEPGPAGGVPWGAASTAAACALAVVLVVADRRQVWRTTAVAVLGLAVAGGAVVGQRTAFERFDFLFRTDGAALHGPVLAAAPARVVLDIETVDPVSGHILTWWLGGRDLDRLYGSTVPAGEVGADTWVLAGSERPGWVPEGTERVMTDNIFGDTLWLTPGPLLDGLAPRASVTGGCDVDLTVEEARLDEPPGGSVDLVIGVRNTGAGLLEVGASPEAAQVRVTWPGEGTSVHALTRDLLEGDRLLRLVETTVPEGTPPGAGEVRVTVVQADGALCGEEAEVRVPVVVAP